MAILAVLLGGVAVTLWRGEPLTAELMTPLGMITAALVWAEKKREESKPDKGGEATPLGAADPEKKGEGDGVE